MALIGNVQDYKEVSTWGAEGGSEYVAFTYDFSVDTGAVGQYGLFKASERCLVKFAYMKVKTACTSGGAATVGVGKSGDLAGVIAATAVASLTANAQILGAALDDSHKMAADDEMFLDIATAALTAGKIEVVFEILKF